MCSMCNVPMNCCLCACAALGRVLLARTCGSLRCLTSQAKGKQSPILCMWAICMVMNPVAGRAIGLAGHGTDSTWLHNCMSKHYMVHLVCMSCSCMTTHN